MKLEKIQLERKDWIGQNWQKLDWKLKIGIIGNGNIEIIRSLTKWVDLSGNWLTDWMKKLLLERVSPLKNSKGIPAQLKESLLSWRNPLLTEVFLLWKLWHHLSNIISKYPTIPTTPPRLQINNRIEQQLTFWQEWLVFYLVSGWLATPLVATISDIIFYFTVPPPSPL